MALLRLVLLLLWAEGVRALWRYRTTEENYQLLTSRKLIYLEYEGTSFIEWEFPDMCIAEDKSSPRTTLKCQFAGTYRIKPKVKTETFEDKERHLPTSSHANCFIWYVTTAAEINRMDPFYIEDYKLILWIYDPETADASERNHTAVFPSESSQMLGKIFLNLGQEPVVHTYFYKNKYYAVELPELGLWVVDTPEVSDDIIAKVVGRPVVFQECFVLDTPFTFPTPKQSFPSKENDISLRSPQNSEFSIKWSACFPTTAVLLSSFGTFYTNDAFKTYVEIKVPSDILTQGLNNKVTDVALTDNGIVFLINGACYKREASHFFKLGAEHKLPESEIAGIQSRYWCSSIYPVQNGKQLSTLAAWTSTELYLGYDEIFNKISDTASLVKLLNFPDAASVTIETVSYDSLPSEVTMLLVCTGCSSSRLFFLAFYNEERQLWGLRDFYLPVPRSSVMRMIYINSALSSGLLWDDVSVYYTYRNNTDNGYFQVSETTLTLSEMSSGSTIHQIILDYFGNILIKMKNNILFAAKTGLRRLVKLPVWINRNQNMILYLNPSANVYMLLIDGSRIHRQTYPLEIEMFSSTFGTYETCSIKSFQHNMENHIYYLDKGDEVHFWSLIAFDEKLAASTSLEVYRPGLLHLERHSTYEVAHGICVKAEVFMFSHQTDYTVESNYTQALELTSGVMTVELKPSVFENGCQLQPQVSHLLVGCPPTRHIVVDSPQHVACERHNFTIYKIPGKFLWLPTAEDQIAYYDWDEYGCLMEIHYQMPFRPSIFLYDGDNYVREVDANFILWEIKGRVDYGYNSSMKNEGCLSKAQSWGMMLAGSKNSTLDDVWGPQNYRSCFEFHENSTNEGLNDAYQILNSTSTNHITWPSSHNAIYVFRVKILDPNYSFCDLKKIFAVRTYGVKERSHFHFLKFCSSIILCTFLVCFIFYFRKSIITYQMSLEFERTRARPED